MPLKLNMNILFISNGLAYWPRRSDRLSVLGVVADGGFDFRRHHRRRFRRRQRAARQPGKEACFEKRSSLLCEPCINVTDIICLSIKTPLLFLHFPFHIFSLSLPLYLSICTYLSVCLSLYLSIGLNSLSLPFLFISSLSLTLTPSIYICFLKMFDRRFISACFRNNLAYCILALDLEMA